MGFLVKKIVSAFLLPLPLALISIGTGIVLLLINRFKRIQIFCFLLGFSCLFIFGLPITANCLINQLQFQYHPLLQFPSNVQKIVVLGGGVSGGKHYPPNLTLNSASLSRLIEGIRLFKLAEQQGGQPELILSGGRVYESNSNAGMMRNTALMLGIHSEQTLIENGSRDTQEEALYLKKKLKIQPFILVTSAFHMPRAIALFKAQGMNPIAAPTQFLGSTNPMIKTLIPGTSSLLLSDIAIHEYLGIAWAKLNKFI